MKKKICFGLSIVMHLYIIRKCVKLPPYDKIRVVVHIEMKKRRLNEILVTGKKTPFQTT